MINRKIFSIDRIEGELAVCISDSDEQITVPLSTLGGLVARDVFSAELENGALVGIMPMPEERDRRLNNTRSRLHALARRTKNN